jgi:hypothetical protein
VTATLLPPAQLAARHADLMRGLVLARMRRRLEESGALVDEHTWFSGHVSGSEAEWSHRLDELELQARMTPLGRLDRDDALLVTAAGLIEDDIRFGALFAALQAPLISRRPCVGLLSWLLAGSADDHELARRCQRLARSGILEVSNTADPRSEWVVKLPVAVGELIQTGTVSPDSLPGDLMLYPATEFTPLDQLWMAPGLSDQAEALPATLLTGALSAVVVRGLPRSGRRTLLGAIAREIGWDLVCCEAATVSDEARLTLAALAALGPVLPVLRCQLGYDETLAVPPLPGVDRAIGITAGPTGGLTGEPLDRPLTLTLQHYPAPARRDLWVRSGFDPIRDDLPAIVDSFLITPGNLVAAADVALTAAAATGRAAVRADDVRVAVGQLNRQQLEPLATRLDPHASPRPVLDPGADEELATLLLRCRYRERLAAEGVTADRGVRALFSGPSGTGKTLAARYLAGCLSLDIYRVNLASVVNKYIGVTERNLDKVLTIAEELGVVLLLDEGDSLMARRTDVNDANDRYANLETNFLLQRLEGFSGIVLITSNQAARIDRAFLRRIDITVDFLPPNPEQRWQILAAHLPARHEVGDATMTEIARRCPLTGGVLRNVALHASLLAMDDGVPLADRHLLAAVHREYRRAGGSCPLPSR